MSSENNTKQRTGSGGRVAMHSPSAIRLLKSRPPASSGPVDPREFLKTEPRIRNRVIAAGSFVLVVLATVLVVGTSAGIVSGPNLVSTSPTPTALTTHGFLELTVAADGWESGSSTPAIARLRAENSDTYTVCHAVPAGVRDTLELDDGRYYLSWITPVGPDGTLYIPPEEELVSVRAGHTTSRSAAFTRVPLEESTFGDYAATIDIVHEAMEHGDETLTGEDGDALMHQLQVNSNEAPNFFIFIEE